MRNYTQCCKFYSEEDKHKAVNRLISMYYKYNNKLVYTNKVI